MKKIITDCDGVLLDWAYAFEVWMADHGYIKMPDTDIHFSMAKRFGISEEESYEKVLEFNDTGVLGYLPAYKDSVEYLTRLHREGWSIEVISMIGPDKYANRLRSMNLIRLFGDIFDYIYCAGRHTEPKKQILESRYKDSNYIWIEDRLDYAQDGIDAGMDTIIMDHPYNRNWEIAPRVHNWKEIYDYAHKRK